MEALQPNKVYELDPSTIIVDERARKDYGNLEEFAENLKLTNGPIQPITINTERHLLAGGRRLSACLLGGINPVLFLVRDVTVGAVDYKEIELFENLYRKELTWQERAKLEREIYELKRRTEGWSQARLAEELGQSVGALNRHVQLGRVLEKVPELADAKTEDEAWKKMRQMEERVLLQELKKRAEAKASSELIKEMDLHADPEDRKKAAQSFLFKNALKDYRVGNALDEMQRIIDIGPNHIRFNFAEVDPPYGIDLHTAVRADSEGGSNLETYHEVERQGYPDFIASVARMTYELLERDAYAIFWFAPENVSIVHKAITQAGFTCSPLWGIWYKGPVGQTQQPARNLASSYEPFFIAAKGSPVLHKQGRSNVFHFSPVPAAQKYHQTQKPIELLSDIIDTFCFPLYRVLVPFLGSGVTLRAAYKASMMGVGWDLEMDHKKHFIASIADDMKLLEDEEDDK